MSPPNTARIRELNDAFRQRGPTWASEPGRAGADEDGWFITDGVQSFGPLFVLEVVGAVQSYNKFARGHLVHDDHDIGAFDLAGQQILWRIDYYDLDLRRDSPDPADADVTRRVITIMLASEY